MKLAIDAMGGDHAPKEIILGAQEAIRLYSDLEITLVGNEEKIRQHLTNEERITIIHTDEVIEGEDEPVRAVRRKKNASMVLIAREVKEGRADACISAGNTGALMTTGLLHVGRIKGIERPALCSTMPTIDGKGFIMLDIGANIDAKASHLLQYAIMGSVYCEKVRGISNPRVGLLNVGTEDKKGTDVLKETYGLLKEAPINFIGNIESRDLISGVADVVVADGLSGNIALKAMEGTALSIFTMLKKELTSSLRTKVGAVLLKPALYGLKDKMDYKEYGGAGLIGLNAPVIKAHGSSDARSFCSAIRQAREMVIKDVTGTIRQYVEEREETKE
ncbi:MAG: phosphate acyltransferase PlsX [Bacillaceae bacterium]